MKKTEDAASRDVVAAKQRVEKEAGHARHLPLAASGEVSAFSELGRTSRNGADLPGFEISDTYSNTPNFSLRQTPNN
jgi:hypothetical protein